MPLIKPFAKARSSRKGKKKPASSKGAARSKTVPRQPAEPQPTWWESLSPERKLDVVGIVLSIAGILIFLLLVASSRSFITATFIRLLSQLLGWGVYALPLGLLGFGMWLILRKIERIPPLSLERAVGIILAYLWVLTLFHAIIAAPGAAMAAAYDAAGGGYIGAVFERLLWFSLGNWGAIIAMAGWLVIALTMIFDVTVREMFGWFSPLLSRLKTAFIQWRNASKPQAGNGPAITTTNGYTPLSPPALPVGEQALPGPIPAGGQPTMTTRSGKPVIQYALPDVRNILDPGSAPQVNDDFIKQRARLIEDTLASFGAPAQVVEISRGPSVTQFGVEPLFVETRGSRTRVRVSKIASLADDLALALAAPRIRIEAPVPGHSYVGIEVPNDEMALVALRDVVESETFQRSKTPLRFALGLDVAGHPITADLDNMPHLLIAGTTGSGKSVCVNSILTCFLLNNTPNELQIVMVDPKRVELTGYNGIPHLFHSSPVVVDMERVIGVLHYITKEMDDRYKTFAKMGARNITDYNGRMKVQGGARMPYLLLVIDELADLMMIAPDETERTITRLAQLARATGIHLILATQRPSVDVVTGLIKANFPARIAFAVASGVDSRVILDQPGAERLLGRGDMLYQAPDAPAPARLQGVFVSDHEIQRLVEYWRKQNPDASPYGAPGATMGGDLPDDIVLKQKPLWEGEESPDTDPLLPEAIDLVRREGRGSVSMLQRRLRIGYTRAARLVDVMEDRGIVGPPEGTSQVRQVLDYGPAAPPKEE